MIIDDRQYDVIIVGSGAGGGTLAQALAPTGKQILVLERGERMSPEDQNRADIDIFKGDRYRSPEQWYDETGEPFSPQANYAVGGNTKIYAATLMRMRERDFEAVQYQDGVTPEWPVKYADFEPYYSAAEQLYQVHGDQTNDPTEPPHSSSYPSAACPHPPAIRPFVDKIVAEGLHPTALPASLTERREEPTGDAEVFGIDVALQHQNVTLITNAKVTALHTNSSGSEIKGVQAEVGEHTVMFASNIVVLACGAVNSAALMLDSANEKHPHGLANQSGMLGRNLMKHLMT
ncbi:MAG: GMC family oxidoreductase, partial [Cyanobacteria bacterium P01_E01_bin.34]